MQNASTLFSISLTCSLISRVGRSSSFPSFFSLLVRFLLVTFSDLTRDFPDVAFAFFATVASVTVLGFCALIGCSTTFAFYTCIHSENGCLSLSPAAYWFALLRTISSDVSFSKHARLDSAAYWFSNIHDQVQRRIDFQVYVTRFKGLLFFTCVPEPRFFRMSRYFYRYVLTDLNGFQLRFQRISSWYLTSSSYDCTNLVLA